MEKLQSGNLVIRSRDERLLFEVKGQALACAEVPIEDVGIIMEFLKAHKERHANRRVGFRIDLSEIQHPDLDQLKVWLETDTGRLTLNPVDLSITGMCVDSADFVGETGARAEIGIAFGANSVILPTIIVRQSDASQRIALHFAGVFGEAGHLDPPRELTNIFYVLESMWLDQNLDLKWNLA